MKTLAKFWREANPQSKVMSVMGRRGSLTSNSLARRTQDSAK
jgi:hypothetical protein